MKWLALAVLSFVLVGCYNQQAVYLTTGKLTGTSCPGTVWLRGGIALDADCVAVLMTADGLVSHPVDRNYADLIGSVVAAVRVRSDQIIIVKAE